MDIKTPVINTLCVQIFYLYKKKIVMDGNSGITEFFFFCFFFLGGGGPNLHLGEGGAR